MGINTARIFGPCAILSGLLLLALIAAPGAFSATSSVDLYNGTITIVNTDCVDASGAQEAALSQGVLPGQPVGPEQYDFTQAYTAEDGMLFNASSPLDSFTIVEANNSYIVVNSTDATTYQSLEVVLNENNTLVLGSGTNVTFLDSTLSLTRLNWFDVDAANVFLNNSRVNFSSSFAWTVTGGSTVVANYSILEYKDVTIRVLNSSALYLSNSTFYTWHSKGEPVAVLGNSTLAPLAWVSDSSVTANGTEWVITNVPDFWVVNSTVSLSNSTIHLFNASTLHLVGTTVNLDNSKIMLHDNSTLVVSCGSTFTGDNSITGVTGPGAEALAGAPNATLGATDISIVESPDTVITLTPAA